MSPIRGMAELRPSAGVRNCVFLIVNVLALHWGAS
uniref:Uncharacterized protein n=1 Tax=Anguilla anguilla TaxID=7936 RepID=A0A0E9QHT8_ANGAN